MYYQRQQRKNILTVIFVLLLLIDGAVWLHHSDHSSAAGVTPQAVSVYGQGSSFTSGSANNGGISATSINNARGAAFDSSGNLYVADYRNHRVLYYAAGSTTATRVYGQNGSFTTNLVNNTNGTANTVSATSLDFPISLALDSSGNLYVADDANNRVLYYAAGSTTATRVYGQNGSFTTNLVNNTNGTANTVSATSLSQPNGVALDSSGNLYVTDYNNNRVLYYAAGSTTATRVYGQAGSFTSGSANNGGISATSLSQPNGVALDSSGNLYVADGSNNRVLYYAAGSTTATRVYGQNGSFTTNLVNNTNGTANTVSATSLYSPSGVALDSSGNLYVADYNNHRVLYYATGSTTATRVYGQAGGFTSNTSNNGGISAASLYNPFGVTIDSSGNLYVADYNNNRVLKFQVGLSVTAQPPSSSPSQGTFSTAASLIDVGSGSTFSDFSGTVSAAIKSGSGTSGAVLGGTTSVTASSGVATFSSLYVDLTGSGYILTLSSTGVGSANTSSFAITGALGPQAVTVYGQSGSFTTNTATEYYLPRTSALDSSGDLYVADTSHHRVLYYAAGSTTATRVYGQGGSFTTTTANTGGISANSFNHPQNLALDSSGNLYVADSNNNRVLYYTAGSTTATRVYGQNGSFTTNLSNNTNGTANTVSATSLNNPLGVALDSSNNLYVVDNGNNRVLYYPSGSTTATRVYGQAGSFTSALVNNTSGTANTVSATSLNQSRSVTLDSSNNVYISDNSNNRVLYYAGTSTTATRVYGQAGSFTSALVNNTSGTANTVSATSLYLPQGIDVDAANNLYVADGNNNRVLYYPSGSTTATRVYGQGGSFTSNSANNTSGTSGVVSANSFNQPNGVSLDANGNIYVTDTNNHRELEFQTALSVTTQPPAIVGTGTAFSTAATLIDVGSGATFSDFSSTVSVAIASGTGGAVLSGTTSASASSGVATFSNLSINLTGASYTLTLSSPGTDAATTSSFGVLNPAGYWHFDEDSGTTAYDSSGNNNSGTLTAGSTWTSGETNSGLSISGSSNYVTMGNPSTLQFGASSSFTVIAWFKTSSTSGSFSRILSKGVGSWNGGFNLGISSGCTGCIVGEIGGTAPSNSLDFNSTTAFNDSKWHQAVLVIDHTAQTAQIYVDGVAQAVSTVSGTCGTASGTTVNIATCSAITNVTTDPFTVGGYTGASGTFQSFPGSIDEVRVYGSALNSSQVQTLYTNDINALSEYAANATFSGTVNSTATYTLPISVTYQLTPAPGWNLSITSTTLTSGSNTLPTTASTITSVTGTCTTNGTCSSNSLTNTISSFPITLPAGTTAPTAVKFFGTAAGSGTGAYTVTPSLSVGIPITAKPGAYTSTITLTAATGP